MIAWIDHWQTLITGVLALVGAVITIWALRYEAHRSERRAALVASMQIASQIRVWLNETVHAFDTHAAYEQPDPDPDPNRADVFPTPGDIPAFPFAESLDSISHLNSEDARNVFRMIERRRNAEEGAKVWAFLDDNETAAGLFEGAIAEIFLDCVAIYEKLARAIGWNDPPVHEMGLNAMQERAARAKEVRERINGDTDLLDSAAAPTNGTADNGEPQQHGSQEKG